MQRITKHHLEHQVDRLNMLTYSPREYRNKETGKTNINNYCLDWAYGGVKLVQVCNEQGAIRDISSGGYVTKREIYNQLQCLNTVLYRMEV